MQLSEFRRFLVWGGFVGLLSTSVIFGFEHSFRLNRVQFQWLVATTYVVATLISYWGHARFTFKRSRLFHQSARVMQFVRHVIATSAIAYVVSLFSALLRIQLAQYVGEANGGVLAFVVVAIASAVGSFLISKRWVFNDTR